MDASAVPLSRVSGLAAPAQGFRAHDRERRETSANMTDTTAGRQTGKFALGGLGNLGRLGDFGALLRRGDIALAILVMAILVVLILPLPPMLLDMALAVSIILSVLIQIGRAHV
jgi:hypothetical protein